MDSEVSFVEGSATDAQGIIELIKQLENETNSIEFDPGLHKLSYEQVEKNLDLIQQSPTNFLLIAKLGTTPIGIVTLIETDEDQPAAELGVGVLQEYWHNEIGTVLVDEALYWASNFSWLNQIWLDVFKNNQHAIQIYRKMQFQTKTPPIKDDQGREILRMELNLSEPA